ncbi:Flp pilus assembly complex ATPase component TadA [bacterium]|nr:Flp pilus assembly complex ATPase component TadA [bacterium]
MNCEQARTEIIAYLKGELSEDQKTKLEEHLARCPACRHELEGARRLLTWTEAASEQAIVKKVDDIIDNAIKSKASDIHFESQRDNTLRVRYRIDGVMHDIMSIDSAERIGIVTRIKMMADVDTSETRIPQDGRMPWKLGSRDYNIRIAFCPFTLGEGIVMRMLDKRSPLLGLDKIYIYQDHLQTLKDLLHQPMGMFFTSGPTGSGKTTTLYSTLLELNKPEVKIMTIEDPVEIMIPGVNHSQICKKNGFTFATALRSFFRHDPDVIMIGEMRCMEDAAISMEAAISGQMVLSQMHTNDAIGVIQRLRDMGIESYVISAALLGAMNQRLVRRVCPDCKERVLEVNPALKMLKITENDLKSHEVFKGKGCDKCHGTGYRGRAAIYELLVIDRHLREMIGEGAPCDELLQAAISNGFMPIREDARRKVLDGLTTAEESLRVLALTE